MNVDELAERRRLKAAQITERPPTMLEALREADGLLVGLLGEAADELLVPSETVRSIARRVDAIVLACINVESGQAAR